MKKFFLACFAAVSIAAMATATHESSVPQNAIATTIYDTVPNQDTSGNWQNKGDTMSNPYDTSGMHHDSATIK